jgi:hypothetical protein
MAQGMWFGEGYNHVYGRTLNGYNVGIHAPSGALPLTYSGT